MAIYHISRPKAASRFIRRAKHPGHGRLLPDQLHGILELSLTTLGEDIVAPGTGKLGLESQHGIPIHLAARCSGSPVIPGTGIKGACRTHYEMLSEGCVLYPPKGVGGKPCNQRAYCEVCSLFGCLGVQGRISFSDAVADGDGAAHEVIAKVRPPWEPKGPYAGEFRFYDSQPGKSDPRYGPPTKVSREGYKGRFRTRLWFRNLTPIEMGRLLLAMGNSKDLTTDFPFRLGGAKYDGLGAVSVKPEVLSLVTPQRGRWCGDACREQCRSFVAAALDSVWADLFAPTLEALAQLLGEPRP